MIHAKTIHTRYVVLNQHAEVNVRSISSTVGLTNRQEQTDSVKFSLADALDDDVLYFL